MDRLLIVSRDATLAARATGGGVGAAGRPRTAHPHQRTPTYMSASDVANHSDAQNQCGMPIASDTACASERIGRPPTVLRPPPAKSSLIDVIAFRQHVAASSV